MKNIKCPECGSNLKYVTHNDEIEETEINSDGTVANRSSNSSGHSEIVCSKNDAHGITEELQELVGELSNTHDY